MSSSKLMVVEPYGPRPESPELPPPEAVTSRPCSWGIRERNVEPQPIFQNIIEKAKGEARKQKAVGSGLFDARGPAVRSISQEDIDELRAALPSNCRFILPTTFVSVVTAYGRAPKGSPLSYQLRKTPVVSEASPKRSVACADGKSSATQMQSAQSSKSSNWTGKDDEVTSSTLLRL